MRVRVLAAHLRFQKHPPNLPALAGRQYAIGRPLTPLRGGGERIRCYDTCTSKLYTKQAAGHNPRPTQTERARQRVSHKFKYLVEEFGRAGCTGCGRCVERCPVNIDIRAILREFAGEGR